MISATTYRAATALCAFAIAGFTPTSTSDVRAWSPEITRAPIRRRGTPEFVEQRAEAVLLNQVRAAFRPSVTELGSVFSVSRQTIYNWIAGRPIATDNIDRLAALASAADIIEKEGIDAKRWARRKLPGGKSFFEMLKEGKQPADAAIALLALAKREKNRSVAGSEEKKRAGIDFQDAGLPMFDELT